MAGWFDELKRRNVVRVGIAYVVIGWVILQAADLVLGAFDVPAWVLQAIIVLMVLGLPVALVIAWMFELTPEGVKRDDGGPPASPRRIDAVIIVALAVALSYFIYERVTRPPTETTAGSEPATAGSDQATAAADRSIGVLPFRNLAADDTDYFADGLTEEIHNALGRTRDLRLASRTNAFRFKDSELSIADIAAQLGVAHILDGSIRRSEDRVRITVSLVDATSGFEIWSSSYDEPIEDVIAVQEEIGLRVANALETTMDPEELQRMLAAGTSSVEAYQAYLTGIGAQRAAFGSGDRFEFLESRAALENAVRIDPEFSQAWWYLTGFWVQQLQANQIFSGLTELSPEEIEARAVSALEETIRHEPDEVTQLRYKAIMAQRDLDFARAAEMSADYLAERPGDSDFMGIHMSQLALLGRYAELSELVERRFDEDRHSSDEINTYLQALRRPEDVPLMRRVATVAVRKYGDMVGVLYQAHRQLLWAGDYDEAGRLVSRLVASELDEANRQLVRLRQACADRRLDDAAALASDIDNRFPDDISARWLAWQVFGDSETADALLDDADEQGNFFSLLSFMDYPYFDVTRYPNLYGSLSARGYAGRDLIPLPFGCERPGED